MNEKHDRIWGMVVPGQRVMVWTEAIQLDAREIDEVGLWERVHRFMRRALKSKCSRVKAMDGGVSCYKNDATTTEIEAAK